MFTLSPDEERRFVEWLHTYAPSGYILLDSQSKSERMGAAEHHGRCVGCGDYFENGDDDWAITKYKDDGYNLHYCSEDCYAVHGVSGTLA